MADIVGQDDEMAGDIERLARAIKLIGKLRPEELFAGPACAVKDQDGAVDLPLGIAMGGAKRGVMEFEFGQDLSRSKVEIGKM